MFNGVEGEIFHRKLNFYLKSQLIVQIAGNATIIYINM